MTLVVSVELLRDNLERARRDSGFASSSDEEGWMDEAAVAAAFGDETPHSFHSTLPDIDLAEKDPRWDQLAALARSRAQQPSSAPSSISTP